MSEEGKEQEESSCCAANTIALPNNNNGDSSSNTNPVVVRDKLLKDVDIMCHIFSFLGGGGSEGDNSDKNHRHYYFPDQYYQPPDDISDITKAAQLRIQLSLVCKGWKEICDTNLSSIVRPMVLTQSDLNACCRSWTVSRGRTSFRANNFLNLHWISQFASTANPLQIGILFLPDLEYKRQLEVLTEILTYSNLTNLRYVILKLSDRAKGGGRVTDNEYCVDETTFCPVTNRIHYQSREVMIDLYSRLLNQIVSKSPNFQVLDLDFYINTSTWCTAGGTPSATTSYTASTLQDCYNTMVLDSLFTTKQRPIQSIRVHHLHLSIYGINNNYSMPIAADDHQTSTTAMIDLNPNNLLIDNLPSLTQLKLSGQTRLTTRRRQLSNTNNYPSSVQQQQQQSSSSFLKISSSRSLRILDVTQLYDTPILISNCPNLERYMMDANCGSGSIPLIENQNDYNRVMGRFVPISYSYIMEFRLIDRMMSSGWSDAPKTTMMIPFLPELDDLPASCKISISSWGYWEQRRGEEGQREREFDDDEDDDETSPTRGPGFHRLKRKQVDWLLRTSSSLQQ